jgi:hypothetical protein
MKKQIGIYKGYTDMLAELPKIGQLQIISYSHKNKWGAHYFNCVCDCGNIKSIAFTSLNTVHVKSCGCLQKQAVKKIGESNKKYTINVNKLIDNDVTAYILGLYAADGSNEKSGITICLKESDIDIINLIVNYFEYTGPLYKKRIKNKVYIRLNISDQRFKLFFMQRGIIKNKSNHYKVPDNLLHNSNFWRGVIDGDGCLFFYKRKYPIYGIALVGTKHTIDSFKNFCERVINQKINVSPYKIKSSENTYTIQLVGKMYISILDTLYSSNSKDICIKRKYNKYLEIKEFYKTK